MPVSDLLREVVSLPPLNTMSATGFHQCPAQDDEVPLYSDLLRAFITKGHGFCEVGCASIEMIMLFVFCFIDMVYCVNYFRMLNQPCTPEIKPRGNVVQCFSYVWLGFVS